MDVRRVLVVASGLLSDALTALLRSWRRGVADGSARRPAAVHAEDSADTRPGLRAGSLPAARRS